MRVKNEKKRNPFPYPVLNPIETIPKTVSRKWQILISLNFLMITVALLDLDQFFTEMEPLATSLLEDELGEERPPTRVTFSCGISRIQEILMDECLRVSILCHKSFYNKIIVLKVQCDPLDVNQ